MKYKFILETPKELIKSILEYDPYVIKVKCLCCSETKFCTYQKPMLMDEKLKIGMDYYPINIIEKVTIRCKNEAFGWNEEIEFKISSRYLMTLFNEDIKKNLSEFIDKD